MSTRKKHRDPPPETKIPAAAGTKAGTNSKRLAPPKYRTAQLFARYRVARFLMVEALA